MASDSQSSSSHSFEQSQVVVVMIPLPAQGHLNQLLQLSRLILSHNIPVHFVGTATHNRQATTRVQGWDPNSISNIHFHDFQVPSFVPNLEGSSHLREPVAALLRSLSSSYTRVIVIHDSLMASVAQDATDIANAENYTFHSSSAFVMFLHVWTEMGEPHVDGYNVPEVPSLEEYIPTQVKDFCSAQLEFHKFNDGNIYNTTRVIEGPYMELIERFRSSKKHWALGPFHPLAVEKKSSEGRHFSVEWLDKQEPKSVMYVSFGTTTAFTEEQIKQIAIGLEQSKQKFIWVLRDAHKGGDEVKSSELFEGFEERVEGMGLIVRDWVPQLEILSHPSTGGFMSHCGWNSSIESISMGVPIAAWPMHSDQPRNSVLITEVLKIGLVVRDWAHRDELVTASVIENVVIRLMATEIGEEMRQKAMNLRNAIHRSLDEGGLSRLEMDSFIDHITR